MSLKAFTQASFVYLVLTVVMTLPAIGVLGTHVLGEGGDPWQTLWRFASTEAALAAAWEKGTVSDFVAQEVFGGGEPRLVNLSVWPWLPFQWLMGQPAAYNVVWLLSFVLSGITMFCLVHWLIGRMATKGVTRELGALLAGVMYMFLPYHVAHAAGHFGALQIQWLPLLILLWLLLLERLTLGRVLGFVGVFSLQTWTEHHYALWFSLVAVLITLWRWQQIGSLIRKQRFWPYMVLMTVLLFFFTVLPYWPTLRLAQSAMGVLDLGTAQTERFSADVLSYVVPAPFHTVWGGISERFFGQHFTGNVAEATQYLGLVPLLLIIFFYQRVPRDERRLWLTVAVLFMIISFGPRLHVLGRSLPIPLPFALVDTWPVFSAVRTVARAGVLVGVSTAVLLGWVVATQVRRPLPSLALVILLLIEFLFVPVSVQSSQLPDVYALVKNLAGTRIVDVPAATNYAVASRALYASTQHGKEVVGSIALERGQADEVLEEMRSLPALRQLLYLRTGHLRQDRDDFFAQNLIETLPDVLRWLDVGGIVIHPDSLSRVQVMAVHDFLQDDMGYAEQVVNDAILYAVPTGDRRGDGVFVARDGRWEHVGYDEKRGSTFGEVAQTAQLTVYNARQETVEVELRFGIAPESVADFQIELDGIRVAHVTHEQRDEVRLIVPVHRRAKKTVVFSTTSEGRLIIQDPHIETVRTGSTL